VNSARLSFLLNSTFALFSVSGCASRDFGSDVNPNYNDVSEAAQVVSSSSNGELQFSVANTWLKLSPSDSGALALGSGKCSVGSGSLMSLQGSVDFDNSTNHFKVTPSQWPANCKIQSQQNFAFVFAPHVTQARWQPAQFEQSGYFTTSVDAQKLHYRKWGTQGTTVILLHPMTSIAELWRLNGVVDALSGQHQVYALDMRGHGGSSQCCHRRRSKKFCM
jgi:hypothetical protein